MSDKETNMHVDEISVYDDFPYRPFEKGRGKKVGKVLFQCALDQDDIADGLSEPHGWFDLHLVPHYLDRLLNSEEIVLQAGRHILVVDYPLACIALAPISNAAHFTRRDLLLCVHQAYRKIYETERQTAETPEVPHNERGQFLNRPATNGTFGISGHDLTDLALVDVTIYQVNGEMVVYLELYS